MINWGNALKRDLHHWRIKMMGQVESVFNTDMLDIKKSSPTPFQVYERG